MALKIRLRQQGRNNRQTYRVVIADTRSPRDGKYIEMLGWYQPIEPSNQLFIDADRAKHWLEHGAILSDQVESLFAQAIPHVLKEHQEKRRVKELKLTAKRRALRKAKKG
jgi:small subunit ribosomal protein S16